MKEWQDFGLDSVEMVPYDILLSYPNKSQPNYISIVDHNEKEVRKLPTRCAARLTCIAEDCICFLAFCIQNNLPHVWRSHLQTNLTAFLVHDWKTFSETNLIPCF